MKVYCILIDTAGRDARVLNCLKQKGINIIAQFSQCFTKTSLLSMFTGKLPYELKENGIGYTTEINCDDILLTEKLKHAGWNIVLRNNYYYDNVIHKNNNFIKSSCYNADEMLNNDNTEKTKLLTDYKYTQGEIDWIKETQKSNAGNTFYFIKYNYLHAKIASSNESDNAHAFLLDVLNAWDYTEKNTFFYLFSDHGDFSKITYKLEPIACVTFAGIKNNNSNFNYNHDKINIKDFYNIIMGNKIDTDIFYGEDGRAEVNSDKSTSCYVAKSICDIIHIVTYHKNIFYGYRYNLAEDTFCECFPDSELKEKLINKIKWISI